MWGVKYRKKMALSESHAEKRGKLFKNEGPLIKDTQSG